MPSTSIDHLLVHRADVQRITSVDLGGGRFKDEYGPFLTDILFRLSLWKSREQTAGDQWRTAYYPSGYVQPGLGIQRMDVICNIVLDDGTVDLNRYRVTGIHQPSLQHHTRLMLEVYQKQADA